MKNKLELKVKKLFPDTKQPSYAHPGDAGLDLFCYKDVIIKPGQREIIGTGVAIELPTNQYVGLVWAKSGLGIREGLITLGGVLDSNYRGEVMIGLYNSSKESYKFEKGDKIAQLLVQSVERCDIKIVKKLSKTERGERKFGSSGKR